MSDKENVATAASTSRFGFKGGGKPAPKPAPKPAGGAAKPAAAKAAAAAAVVPLQDAAAGSDPCNLLQTAIDAMPDNSEQWNQIANVKFKGKAWDMKAKCASPASRVPRHICRSGPGRSV